LSDYLFSGSQCCMTCMLLVCDRGIRVMLFWWTRYSRCQAKWNHSQTS